MLWTGNETRTWILRCMTMILILCHMNPVHITPSCFS